MEETLMVGVCLGCQRRRFDVRAVQVGDETRELCPKCRRGPAGAAAQPIATLVPGRDGSLEFDEPELTVLPMNGEGAPGLISVAREVKVSCGHAARTFINRFGRTRCFLCDADRLIAAAVALCFFFLSSCGPAPFVPLYEGEPECGSPTTVHAVLGEICERADAVACDCEERRTLECPEGVWRVGHWGCAGGLGVSVERSEGSPR